jgi:hypothetical protein
MKAAVFRQMKVSNKFWLPTGKACGEMVRVFIAKDRQNGAAAITRFRHYCNMW